MQNEELEALQTMANNFKNNFKDYNLTFAEGGRRYKVGRKLYRHTSSSTTTGTLSSATTRPSLPRKN